MLAGTYTLRILQAFFDLFIKIAPYLIISIFIHVVLMRTVHERRIRLNTRSNVLSIAAAAVLGMISPLPTYAAVPIGISFIPLGIPVSALMTFIIASPLINPGVFFLTLTQLGAEIAIARLIAAFVISICGGVIAGAVFKSIKEPVQNDDSKREKRSFFDEFKRTSLFLSKPFFVALLLSAIVKAMVSPQFVNEILGQHIRQSLLVAIALGVPFYSCGGAAIPFIEVLSDLGMNKGAVLAFFIAGPATKLETLYIFKSLLGIKILVFYLILTSIGAYIFGLIMLL